MPAINFDKCASVHSAIIFDRGGTHALWPLTDLGEVQWERTRDTMSGGSVKIFGDACSRQADVLNQIEAHRHELVIFRGAERVWEGPIHRVGDTGSMVEIFANDVLDYLDNTPLTQEWNNAYGGGGTTTVTQRIGDIIEYELTHGRTQKNSAGVDVLVPAWEDLNPPINVAPHLVIHHFPNEAGTSAVTEPYQMTVGQHLESLARTSGIDYTAVGRAIHVWDVSRGLGLLETWTESNFRDNVKVTQYGADHAQSSYVVGSEGNYGSALNEEHLDFYGPWTTIFTAYQEEGTAEPSAAVLDSQARRNLSGRSPIPIEVRIPDNSSIILTDVLSINDLVPGVQVPLRATLNVRRMTQLQKIDHVRVTETGEGEDVQVILSPATKPDSDVETP